MLSDEGVQSFAQMHSSTNVDDQESVYDSRTRGWAGLPLTSPAPVGGIQHRHTWEGYTQIGYTRMERIHTDAYAVLGHPLTSPAHPSPPHGAPARRKRPTVAIPPTSRRNFGGCHRSQRARARAVCASLLSLMSESVCHLIPLAGELAQFQRRGRPAATRSSSWPPLTQRISRDTTVVRAFVDWRMSKL